MEATERLEVWANVSALLSFDGRVLEVFGLVDVHRFHIAYRPVVLIGKKMVSIRPEHGGQLSLFYDKERRAEIEVFAERFNSYDR